MIYEFGTINNNGTMFSSGIEFATEIIKTLQHLLLSASSREATIKGSTPYWTKDETRQNGDYADADGVMSIYNFSKKDFSYYFLVTFLKGKNNEHLAVCYSCYTETFLDGDRLDYNYAFLDIHCRYLSMVPNSAFFVCSKTDFIFDGNKIGDSVNFALKNNGKDVLLLPVMDAKYNYDKTSSYHLADSYRDAKIYHFGIGVKEETISCLFKRGASVAFKIGYMGNVFMPAQVGDNSKWGSVFIPFNELNSSDFCSTQVSFLLKNIGFNISNHLAETSICNASGESQMYSSEMGLILDRVSLCTRIMDTVLWTGIHAGWSTSSTLSLEGVINGFGYKGIVDPSLIKYVGGAGTLTQWQTYEDGKMICPMVPRSRGNTQDAFIISWDASNTIPVE